MQTTIAQQFRVAIQNVMRSPDFSGKNEGKLRAKVFIDQEEPKLARMFLLDQTERLFRLEERAVEREVDKAGKREDPQMKFAGEGFAELFTGLRQRLPVKSGNKVRIEEMTVTQLRESAAIIRANARKRAERGNEIEERRAAYLEQLADHISPYAQTHRKLKFGDYLELRAAGVPAAAKTLSARG